MLAGDTLSLLPLERLPPLPPKRQGLWRAPALLGICALLAACGHGQGQTVDVAVIGAPASLFAAPASPPAAASADQHLLLSATREGLVAFDEEGKIVPAIADRWIVADDGQSFIFRLRDGTWPDGAGLTGDSVRQALHAAIEAARKGPLAGDLAMITDVRAMAGRVVEIRLTQPMPDFLQLLAQPELGVMHHGKGTGPMLLHREGDAAVLVPIAPEKRGAPAVEGWADMAHDLRLRALPADAALAELAAGHVQVVLGGGFADLPRLRARALDQRQLRLDPVSGLFGLAVADTGGLLATPQLREAIAMAIDRDSLATTIAPAGWAASSRVLPTGLGSESLATAERWSDIDLDGRRTLALRRIALWAGAAHQHPVLRIALPEGPGADLLFDRLSNDLADVEVGAQRVGMDQPADLRLVDEVAPYARLSWFFSRLSCRVRGPGCAPQADALAQQAALAADPASARALYGEAGRQLAEANVFIPFGPPIRWSAVAGGTTGFAINRIAVHPLLPLAIRPR